jgi:hypothetical protein
MINPIIFVFAFIAGALLYWAMRKDIEEYFFLKLDKNILVPVFIVMLVISGVYLTQTVHLMENAQRSSNAQQNVFVAVCIIENEAVCQNKTNASNNITSERLQRGEILVGDFYISFSLMDAISRNVLTYFCFGLFVCWGICSIWVRK